MLYHVFTKTLGVLAKLYFRAWKRGYQNIPKKGAAIIASNHLAVIDSFVLPSIVWRKIWFIGKKEYFQTDTIGHRFQKWFFESVSVYPVDRNGGKSAQDALNVGREAIKKGNLFGIYPEGTRSPDGNLYKGHTGAARLALEEKTPVIPVAMIGTRDAQKPGQFFPKPKRVGTIFGQPLDFSHYYKKYDTNLKKLQKNPDDENARKISREILREVSDEIMMALHEISGQTYVDMYASEAKTVIHQGKNIIEYAKNQNIKVLDPVL